MSPGRARDVVTAVGLAVAGVVHLLPLPGLLGASMLERLYGVAVDNPGIVLLLRHRALLFGLLGAGLVMAIARRDWRGPMIVAGLVSAGAFLLLAWPLPLDATLQRVVIADGVALLGLLLAGVLTLTADAPRRPAP